MPAGLPSAAYFHMENTGNTPLTLLAVHNSHFGSTRLHTSQGKSGGMKTVSQLVVPAGGSLDFAPGGHHVMLEQPSSPPTPGTNMPLSFLFEGSLLATADCAVKPANTLQ